MTISEDAQAAGRAIAAAPAGELPATLCAQLSSILRPALRVAPGAVSDGASTTAAFAAVISTIGDADAPAPELVAADNAAAIVDAIPELDIAGLEAAYRRIAAAKRLAKRPASTDQPAVSTNTIGFIYAQRAAVPIEAFAAELERLNSEHPHEQWPDMVVIAGAGVINYGYQFPGEGIGGDYLPPAPGAAKGTPPPMYVVMAIRPIPDHAFNQMASFLTGHLAFFAPELKTADHQALLEGMPNICIPQGGYQYNLVGDLIVVPPEFRNDRYMPPPPLIIDGPDGKPMGAISRLPWADGAVLMLQGKLPLEGLMVFLDAESRTTLITMSRPNDIQLSYVLPLSLEQYRSFLMRFQTRSNMRVRPSEAKWMIKTLINEGTSTPFMARILLGLLKLRNNAYESAPTKEKFDAAFQQMTTALMAARDAVREFDARWQGHAEKVSSGACVRRAPHRLIIDDDPDRELRRLMDEFLNASVRALKTALPQLASELGANLGFWFQKEAAFQRHVTTLEATDPVLADYLRQARADWSEQLIMRRNSIEHEGWSLPRVAYPDDGNTVTATEPLVDGRSATDFMRHMLDRLCCALEDIIAHLLSKRMAAGIGLHEIALAQRLAKAPERFRVTVALGGEELWTLRYPASQFEGH